MCVKTINNLKLTLDEFKDFYLNHNYNENMFKSDGSINHKNGMIATDPKTNKSNRKIKMVKIVKKLLFKYKDIDGIILD